MKGKEGQDEKRYKEMMAKIAEAIEKRYTCVKVTVKVDEWEKGDYRRLYISLVCTAEVNGKEKTEEANFGFINLNTNRYNLDTNRYNVKTYDMRHFDLEEFAPAKVLYDYTEAYKMAESENTLYVAKEGYRYTLGLSKEEQAKGISRKKMLDKSLGFGIPPSAFDKFWTAVGDAQK